jgi:hypothetical protein
MGMVGGAAGGAILTSKHNNEEAGPRDAAVDYAGTAMATNEIHEHIPEREHFASRPTRKEILNAHETHRGTDITLGGLAGGATAAAVGTAMTHSHSQDDKNPKSDEQKTNTTDMADQVPHGIETKSPVDKDFVPAELNGLRSALSATLTPPPSTMRRSKSKKEIVEDAIISSPGNNPDRRITPGAWPETPVVEEGGLF